ncbi:YmfL family putative regulatory protein [Gilliamella sp. Lep-s21]|uniref:YmfL family putative regulatory protein n=1 Tax=unclassified Gilliamella TaxID=2685620 RepID=UPI00130A04D9|nr:DNA-binding protein [Gilliamella sp. Lep-s35]MWP68627.1 DNA-binding protein [Gilliamella sp. Lep-s5]MWP76705.1 DNA-binding protein [Gilliamella sp. Lep-s21]
MDNRNYPTPKEITDAIHQLITAFNGKYPEMAKRLDPTSGTENALRNRVRQLNGQMVPLGMILEMEAEANSNVITEAIAKYRGGVFVKLPEFSEFDNDDLLNKFNNLIAELGQFCRQHNEFTSDGILDKKEKKSLKATSYAIQCRLSEIIVITEMIFGNGDR